MSRECSQDSTLLPPCTWCRPTWMNKETLQKSLSLKAWKQVVAGSKDKHGLLKKEDMRCLIEILRLAKLKEQSKYILALLDLICDMPVLSSLCCPDYVKLICPNHPKDMSNSKTVHFVTPIHFYLLEEIEGAFGTTEQILASTDIPNLREPIISALTSRLSCPGRENRAMTKSKSMSNSTILPSIDRSQDRS